MTLRIGVVGPQFPDSFADNIVDSLRRMGHEAYALGPVGGNLARGRVAPLVEIAGRAAPWTESLFQRPLVARVEEIGPELVITVEASILPAAVAAIQATGCLVALWFPDHVANLGRQRMFVAPYDLICFKDPLLAARAGEMLGLPVLYLPEACNPSWHRPPPRCEAEPVIVVAGNMYPSRVLVVERMVKAGLPLRLYGPPVAIWLNSPVLAACHTGRYISREDKAQVFRSAAAVLNTLHPGEMAGLNCRLFEAAGCGAPVLTEFRPELPKLFEPSVEVAAFVSFDELVDKAKLLLDDPDQGRAMGDRASARAHADHTYDLRLAELISEVTS